jgi:hypothetical protein
MSNLGRRIRNLEARLTDEHGLVPHTPKWRAYWTEWMNKFLSREHPPGRIPLDAARLFMRNDQLWSGDAEETDENDYPPAAHA